MLRFERTTANSIDVHAGLGKSDRIIGRIRRGRGMGRHAPYFFDPICLTTALSDPEARAELRLFASTGLGMRFTEAEPKVREFLETWRTRLTVSSMFMGIDNVKLADLIPEAGQDPR
jgi:hypothetical protein